MRYIPQLDPADCGAACLAMVADHFGRRHSLAQVRHLAGTDRHGTNLAGLVRGGRALGFETRALKGPSHALGQLGKDPVIAHLRLETAEGRSDHFVVVVVLNQKKVRVFDPLYGVLRMALRDFVPLWTGYVVVLSPQTEGPRPEMARGLFSRFLPLLRPHALTLGLVGVGALVLVILGVLGSLYFRYLVDDILPSRSWIALHVASAGVLVLVLFQVLLENSRRALLLHLSVRLDGTLLWSFLGHVLSLPLGFFETRMTGDTVARLDQLTEIRSGLADAILVLVLDTLLVVVVGAVLAVQSGVLFLVSLVSVPLVALVVAVFSRFFSANYQKLMAESADVQATLVEALHGMATVKALGAEERVQELFAEKQSRFLGSTFRVGLLELRQGVFLGVIHGWSTNLIYWVGSVLIFQEAMTLGQLLSFGALVGFFLGPLQRLVNLQANLQKTMAAGRRVGEILDLEPERTPKVVVARALAGPLTVSEVTFRYGARRPVLAGVSLEIPRGARVAFVGPSGSGKSSLVKLFLKFYAPEAGRVAVDGVDLQDLATGMVRASIGYVPQEVMLFSGSIYENLCLGRPGTDLEAVIRAARRAGADGFIEAQPDRYATVLAERGASLSGGERQRLGLARALVGDPPLLILDEATSNLDAASERHVLDAIRGLHRAGTTVILVAHRLATVVDSDRIFVFDRGRVVEQGTHEELRAQGGVYSHLWDEGCW